MGVDSRRKYLLVFDLNGTLIDRLVPKDKEKRKIVKALNLRGPTMSVNRYKIWIRPYAKRLFKEIPESVGISIWTSAYKHTCFPVIKRLFDKDEDFEERFEFIWWREECDNTSLNDGRKQETKDLSKVWEKTKFTPKNTLLVDNSAYKGRLQPNHLIKIPTFDVSKEDWIEDTYLLTLLEFIKALDKEQPSDLVEFVKEKRLFQ